MGDPAHSHDAHTTADDPRATHDPVCGHWVVPELAHATTTHRGETIHFCSVACHRAFTATPERFFPRLQRRGGASALGDGRASRSSMGFLDKMRAQAPAGGGRAQDPVCHMMVDPAKAAGSSKHGAETYYFCSPGCKTKFDADPHKYLGAHSHGPHEHHH